MQVFNGLQGVFVHREAMRNIAHGQRVNALQLRQKQRQQVKGVHGAQRVRRVRLRQDFLQKFPKVASAREAARPARPRLLQLMLGRRAELETALRDQAEGAKEKIRIGQILRLLKKNQAVHNGKIRIGKTGSPGFQLPVKERLRRGHFLEQLAGNPVDGAGMAEIDSHPIGGVADIWNVWRADFLGRRIVLRVPGQQIVVALIPEMQKAAHGGEECETPSPSSA